jgi:antitoxin component YwqK of YwqJK toxin-antitoxin module
MKKLLLLSALFIFACSIGNEVIDLTDPQVENYVDVNASSILSYKGIPFSGVVKNHTSNLKRALGWRSWEIEYIEGIRNGKATYYFKNGQIAKYGNFKDGMKDGIWFEFFDVERVQENSFPAGFKKEDFQENLPVKSEKNYRFSNLYGLSKTFYVVDPKYGGPYTTLSDKIEYISTKYGNSTQKHGPFERYLFDQTGDYSDQIIAKGTFKNNRLHGQYTSWNGGPDYAIKFQTEYKNGVDVNVDP